MPHLWPDHKNFLQATLYEKVRFAIFQQELQNSTMFDGLLRFRISEKWANLLLPLNIQKQKVFQRQGGFALLTPQPGALPLDPAYRLALRALAMAPLCQILNTPLHRHLPAASTPVLVLQRIRAEAED